MIADEGLDTSAGAAKTGRRYGWCGRSGRVPVPPASVAAEFPVDVARRGTRWGRRCWRRCCPLTTNPRQRCPSRLATSGHRSRTASRRSARSSNSSAVPFRSSNGTALPASSRWAGSGVGPGAGCSPAWPAGGASTLGGLLSGGGGGRQSQDRLRGLLHTRGVGGGRGGDGRSSSRRTRGANTDVPRGAERRRLPGAGSRQRQAGQSSGFVSGDA